MRDIGFALLACFASLSLPVLGDKSSSFHQPISSAALSFEGRKSAAASFIGFITTSTSTVTASLVAASPLSTSQPHSYTIITIDVSSFTESTSIFNPSVSTTPDATANFQESTTSMSSSTSGSEDDPSHRTVVIILAVVLGVVGLILIGVVIYLVQRFRRGQAPFLHRGASPINDDEIASWRRTAREQKLTLPPLSYQPATQEVSGLHLNSPGWTWAASPSSIRTVSAHITDPPKVLTQAPNARIGLTDEVLRGAEPFITPPKRQTSRLSKLPPGHSRTKSRRSSMSGKSLWSPDRTSNDIKTTEPCAPWYAVDDAMSSSNFRSTDHGSSSPGTSDFDDMVGGLSPRPASRPRQWAHVSREDIGRAIS